MFLAGPGGGSLGGGGGSLLGDISISVFEKVIRFGEAIWDLLQEVGAFFMQNGDTWSVPFLVPTFSFSPFGVSFDFGYFEVPNVLDMSVGDFFIGSGICVILLVRLVSFLLRD